MTYLIDSDFVIDRLAGRPAAIRLIDSLVDRGLSISLVTYAEVDNGIAGSRDPIAAENAFRDFLLLVDVLPISMPVMLRFAQIRSELRRQGHPLESLDLIIAATAIHHDLTLVTRNVKHFERIPDLKLYRS